MGAADDTHQARCGEGKVAVPWEFGARTASAALWMRRLRGGCRGRGRARCSAADKPVAPFAEDGDNRDGQHDRRKQCPDSQLHARTRSLRLLPKTGASPAPWMRLWQ